MRRLIYHILIALVISIFILTLTVWGSTTTYKKIYSEYRVDVFVPRGIAVASLSCDGKIIVNPTLGKTPWFIEKASMLSIRFELASGDDICDGTISWKPIKKDVFYNLIILFWAVAVLVGFMLWDKKHGNVEG